MEDEKKDIEKQNIEEEELQDFPEDDSMFYEQNETIEPEVDNSELNEENDVQEENLEETKEEQEEEQKPEEEQKEEISYWEEFGSDNSVVKKYIFYVSKDFVPFIDSLTVDERTAYINDAIQKKIDYENEEKQKQKKQKLLTHFIIMILIFAFMTPVVLLLVHKSIMATFKNYKYSQDNFEKLYKQRFEKDKMYMRFIKFNKELEKKQKNLTK